MHQSNQTFKAADLSQRFQTAYNQFNNLLASSNSQAHTALRQKLHDGLKEYKDQGALTVAFIGQYSAGKSTIISALTGRRDIHIDADIATGSTTPYDWNGIKIIDTPGLFTDRTDHDEITYEAISQADLLVFCLTHMLFDTNTIDNFKKLAYDKGYRWKIMLVINKMSAAAGEDAQKIASYRHSIDEALKPYKLDEFPVCFIDAKDHCEGIDEDDDFLTEISRFDTFISELNHFVERRSSLTKLDTPVRIVLSCLDDALIALARNSNEDTTFLEVLARMSRRIDKERERLRTKMKSIALEMSAAISSEGTDLALSVGEPDFEDLYKHSEIKVREHCEKVGEQLDHAFEKALESIKSEVVNELKSNVTQAFVAQFNFNSDFTKQHSASNIKHQQVQDQIEWLQKIGNQVGVKITQAATKEHATIKQGFLQSTNVVGSSMHQGVYNVGKFIGFKFKPWQAVGIAKNIGNAARFLGPALALVSIGIELHSEHQEREQEEKMADVRRDITSQFQAMVVELEQQIKGQLQEFESQVYVQLESDMAKARQQSETAMTISDSELGKITTIRQDFEAILQDIHKVAIPTLL